VTTKPRVVSGGEAQGPASTLARARAHYDRKEWARAYELLSGTARENELASEDLERLAWSAALVGRDEEMLAAFERLYHASLHANECLRAARAAFWSGFRLGALGEPSRASAWLLRAQHLVERHGEDCAVRGYLLLPAAHRHLVAGDYAAASTLSAEAGSIGERFGEAELIALARNLQGRALLRQGEAEAGLALIDESMLTATSGDISPIVTGLLYCAAISECQRVHALDRAREWTAALAAWCDAQPQLVTFTGACLVHRAEILQLGGAWGESIEQAERVARGQKPQAVADACYQRAEILRLRGELAEAEEAYRSASQAGRDPQPGLALLRLAQGRVDVALSAIRRTIAAGRDPFERTRLLPSFVEILLAAGEIEEARAASVELESIAARFDIEVLSAMAAHARGAVLLAGGDAQGALEPLRYAFAVWQRLGAPYLAARLRVALGRACQALGDGEGAALELVAAREIFARLGAAPDLATLDANGKRESPGKEHGLSARELQVLRLVATGKTNRAIAEELCLSEKTVDRHVSNIFTKVNVTSRAAATAFAYEHRLV